MSGEGRTCPQTRLISPVMSPAPFDSVARDYDTTFTETATGRMQRERVWAMTPAPAPPRVNPTPDPSPEREGSHDIRRDVESRPPSLSGEGSGVGLNGREAKVRVIEALDGQIVTGSAIENVPMENGLLLPDPAHDILKISVVNRYAPDAPPAVAFVRGFGLQRGALASSVAHDSHNIVAVGCDDSALAAAVNAVIETKGGIAATDGAGDTRILPLPIAGLMSQQDGYALAHDYAALDAWTKSALGCTLRAPFMVLSFLALPVIPKLKITDLGLFDVERFEFCPVSVGDA